MKCDQYTCTVINLLHVAYTLFYTPLSAKSKAAQLSCCCDSRSYGVRRNGIAKGRCQQPWSAFCLFTASKQSARQGFRRLWLNDTSYCKTVGRMNRKFPPRNKTAQLSTPQAYTDHESTDDSISPVISVDKARYLTADCGVKDYNKTRTRRVVQLSLKPCPHCRRKVRLSQKTATAPFGDSLTFLRQCGHGLRRPIADRAEYHIRSLQQQNRTATYSLSTLENIVAEIGDSRRIRRQSSSPLGVCAYA